MTTPALNRWLERQAEAEEKAVKLRRKVADRPHWITIWISIIGWSLALVAIGMSFFQVRLSLKRYDDERFQILANNAKAREKIVASLELDKISATLKALPATRANPIRQQRLALTYEVQFRNRAKYSAELRSIQTSLEIKKQYSTIPGELSESNVGQGLGYIGGEKTSLRFKGRHVLAASASRKKSDAINVIFRITYLDVLGEEHSGTWCFTVREDVNAESCV